jgi:hypothetical protein
MEEELKKDVHVFSRADIYLNCRARAPENKRPMFKVVLRKK